MKDMAVDVVIVASGKGRRTNKKTRKQYIEVNGLPLMCYALKTFDKCKDLRTIYLVVPEKDMEMCRSLFLKPLKMFHEVILVGGGPTRQASVLNALESVNNNHKQESGSVLIHDAARPFVTKELILECTKKVKPTSACVPVIPVVDSLKKIIYLSEPFLESLKRENFWLAQTPQAFHFEAILESHREAKKHNIRCTDDSELAEKTGITVNMILGSSYNIKITTNDDLILAEAIAKTIHCKGTKKR